MKPIFVTGASGILGRSIVTSLNQGKLPMRLGLRDLAKAPAPGIDAVHFDYGNPATFETALAGAGGLLLMAPPLDPAASAKLRPVVERAKQVGLSHIVFISAFGANYNEQAPLRIVEHLVMDSGIPYTILRPNFFMENFSAGFLAGTIKGQHGIFLAAGDGKTSFISTADIADVVAATFSGPLTGKELDLTGAEALDHDEVAAILSEASGSKIEYRSLTDEQMVAGARAMDIPEPAIGYMTALYGAVRGGYAATVTGDVEKVLGRGPMAFREFARRNAAVWM